MIATRQRQKQHLFVDIATTPCVCVPDKTTLVTIAVDFLNLEFSRKHFDTLEQYYTMYKVL